MRGGFKQRDNGLPKNGEPRRAWLVLVSPIYERLVVLSKALKWLIPLEESWMRGAASHCFLFCLFRPVGLVETNVKRVYCRTYRVERNSYILAKVGFSFDCREFNTQCVGDCFVTNLIARGGRRFFMYARWERNRLCQAPQIGHVGVWGWGGSASARPSRQTSRHWMYDVSARKEEHVH